MKKFIDPYASTPVVAQKRVRIELFLWTRWSWNQEAAKWFAWHIPVWAVNRLEAWICLWTS